MHQLNVFLHVAFAVASLGLGLIQLVLPHGDAGHRKRGRIFLSCMAVSLAAATMGALVFRPDPTLAATTALVAYLLFSGIRTLRRGPTGPERLDSIVAAAGFLGGAGVVALLASGVSAFWNPSVTYSLIGGLMFWSGLDLLLAWRGGWRTGLAARNDHGARMTFAVGGLLSAGAGTVAPQLAPWSQLAPSVLAVAYVGGLLVLARWRRAPGVSP